MDTGKSAIEDGALANTTDWLAACRRSVEAMREMLDTTVGLEARASETGSRGKGGDRTLVIDAAAERIVFDELTRLHAEGHRFRAVSEERGDEDFSGSTDSSVLVVIDPIDGSLNAKRGLAHHALSIAVATGGTMAEVAFGFVYDFGTSEEWWAELGAGAFLNGERLDPRLGERRGAEGRLEILGIESADPRWVRDCVDDLVERAYRLRALGSTAISLCQVAAARFDGMISLRNCRAVDAAAAQLIVREGGGLISFPGFEDRLGAPLDVIPHSRVVAARSTTSLADLEEICRRH